MPKPSDGQDPSKAAQNIRRHENKTREATRVVIDLRGVNKLTVPLPAIALSSYKDLQKEFKNTNVSTFDLSGFFFTLPLSYEPGGDELLVRRSYIQVLSLPYGS